MNEDPKTADPAIDPAIDPVTDDRTARRERRLAELARLTDDELAARFWELCEQVVSPLTQLARAHTTPSVERSVLLRAGVDSVTSQGVVARIAEAGLLGHGAGNVLLRVARRTGTDLPGAAAAVLADATVLDDLFGDEVAR